MDEQKKPEITEIAIVDEHTIRDKIYIVRGVEVMLDFELAEIYGYETKNFNRQVKNNAAKFEGDDFMFQLTNEETAELSRCKNFTLKRGTGRGSNLKYNPYAFTEQGVYMLMTVLRGELATRQSRAIVIALKALKDYVNETQGLLTQRDLLRLSIQTAENTNAIKSMSLKMADQQKIISDQQKLLLEHDEKLVDAFDRFDETVKKSEISPVMLQFELPENKQKEYLLRDGHPAKADATYIDIYSKATKTVYIIDNYISIKTLHLLQDVKSGVAVTVFSDNLRNNLHRNDKSDFQVEFPNIPIDFITTGGIMHDRFIVLDYGTVDERFYHCGASSKDAATKLTTAIMEITSQDMKTQMHALIDQMKRNPQLILR